MATATKPKVITRPQVGKQAFSSQWTQMYPPKPHFTEEDMEDLTGKIYIVTGGNSGIGKEVASVLFWKNAKVYVAARSETKATETIHDIQKRRNSTCGGKLVYLALDLSDLNSVRASANKFLSLEGKLDGLVNNAAVQALADKDGSQTKTKQGWEVHMGVNVLGPYLFTRLLTGALISAAADNKEKDSKKNDVRVVWVSSMGTETIGELSRGLSQDYVDYWPLMSPLERYGLSKAGNWLHGVEFARRYTAQHNIISMPVNPGHLATNLYREGGFLFKSILRVVALFPPKLGAYTELYALLSPELTATESGKWVVPWGRLYPIREDLEAATKSEEEGGNGHARIFWDWCDEQVKEFL